MYKAIISDLHEHVLNIYLTTPVQTVQCIKEINFSYLDRFWHILMRTEIVMLLCLLGQYRKSH